MFFFAYRRDIAVVHAIIKAKEGDKGSLSLGFREEVRLYYSAPDPTLIAYKVIQLQSLWFVFRERVMFI